MEAEMSTSTGASVAGKPIAKGFGLNSGALPPKGATIFVCGPEEARIAR